MHNKKGLKIFLSILVILILVAAIYFTFFFYYSCDDLSCYRAHQEKCAKTKFTYEGLDAIWFYKIQGRDSDSCQIDVTLKSLKEGSAEKQILEGETMTCYLPYGNIVSPEKDLSRCHGILKEEMQNIIIQNMHQYIFEKIGNISAELNAAV